MLQTRFGCGVVFSAVWLGTVAAPAQSPATRPTSQPTSRPAATTPTTRERLLRIDELTFELGFDAEAQRRTVSTDTRGNFPTRHRQRNDTWRFEETFGLRSEGAIIADRWLRYQAMARWGLSQERFSEKRPGQDLVATPDGDILEYDFRLEAFPAGKLSGEVYASQLDDRIPRPFLPSLDRRRERLGAALFFNDPKLPMRLSWEHTFDRISSRTRGLLDDEDRRQDTLRYEVTWQPTEYHSLRLEYEYDDRREKYSGTGTRFDTARNYLTLNHVLQFGKDHRSRLETLARLQDESGDLSRDTYEIAPQLRLQHTDSLFTTYRAQYLQETFQRIRTRVWRGEVGLTHQLGTDLTSNFNIYALRQDTEERGGTRGGGLDETEWGGLANFAYSRENALGRFSSHFSYNHVRVRTNDGRRGGLVLAEAATFRDPRPVYLSHENVELQSILVTDAGRTRTFVPGRDYVAVQIGQFAALERVRTGQIVDGQTVFVSYTYRTFDDFELSRDRIDLRVQQDFKFGLTPYYAGSIQNENADRSRFRTYRPRNQNRHRVGATYRRPRWSVGLEYEYNDDAIDPFEALHVNGDVVLVDRARHQLTGRGTLSRFLFDGSRDLEQHDTTLLDLGISYRYLLSRDLEANAAATYRFEDDSLFGRTHGVDVTGSLAYRFGLFSALFEVEYDALNLPSSSDDSVAVWLKLRREIPLIARRR